MMCLRIMLAMLVAVPFGNAQSKPSKKEGDKSASFVESSSRKLAGDKKTDWVIAMKTKLPMAKRETGPFGLPQNLDVKIVERVKPKAQPGAFLKAIKAISVNTVMASEKKFAIGAREFREGDAFPVILGQRQFNIKVVSVKSSYILFQNTDTGERVKKSLNALPPGVSQNKGIGNIKGVTPNSRKDSSPLRLPSNSEVDESP